MIVVDTNVIVYFYVTGVRSAQAQAVMQKDSYWIAPPLWRSEFRNVLAQYIRRQLLTAGEALKIMRAAETLLKNQEYDLSSENVLRLAEISQCSAYDCEFVALAKRFGLLLVTADEKIIREFPDTAVSLEKFTQRR